MRFLSYAYRVGRAQYQHGRFVNVLHGGRHCGNIGEVESRQPVLGARAHLSLSLALSCAHSRGAAKAISSAAALAKPAPQC
jgi:hypothetical protein